MARAIIFLSGALALLAVSPRADIAQKVPDRAELAWTILPTRYVHYTAQGQRQLSPKGTLRTGDELKALKLDYNGFFGHEISPAGEFVKRIEPLVEEEALLQLAMYTPVTRQKVGATWQKEWSFARVPEFGAYTVISTWELMPQQEYAGAPCWVISGTHKLKPPEGAAPAAKTLRSFEVASTGWFDQQLGALRGAKMQLLSHKPSNQSRSPMKCPMSNRR